jgi:hypothetical protein
MICEILYGKRRLISNPSGGNRWKQLPRNCSTKPALSVRPSSRRGLAERVRDAIRLPCCRRTVQTLPVGANPTPSVPSRPTSTGKPFIHFHSVRHKFKPLSPTWPCAARSVEWWKGVSRLPWPTPRLLRFEHLGRRKYHDVTYGCAPRRCCVRVG